MIPKASEKQCPPSTASCRIRSALTVFLMAQFRHFESSAPKRLVYGNPRSRVCVVSDNQRSQPARKFYTQTCKSLLLDNQLRDWGLEVRKLGLYNCCYLASDHKTCIVERGQAFLSISAVRRMYDHDSMTGVLHCTAD